MLFLDRPHFRGNRIYKCEPVIGDRVRHREESHCKYMKRFEMGVPMNRINSRSVKLKNTKKYQKYGLELITTKTEKKNQDVYFTVNRYEKVYLSSNIVSLVAKREIGMLSQSIVV